MISFNIGRCYEQLGDNPKALRAYREYLKALPEAKDKASVAELILNLEKKLKDQGVQQLLVFTEPPGAVVFIDGKARGSSPASVELRPGSHKVMVTLEGMESAENALVMPADKSAEVSFKLKPKTAGTDAPKTAGTDAPKATGTDAPKATGTDASKADSSVAQADTKPGATSAPVAGTTVNRQSSGGGGLRSKAWIPAAGGVVLLVVGGVFYGMAKGTEGQLRSGDASLAAPSARSAAIGSGQTSQAVGFALGGIGIAALAAAGTMFFWPAKPSSGVAVRVTPGVGGAVMSGEFP